MEGPILYLDYLGGEIRYGKIFLRECPECRKRYVETYNIPYCKINFSPLSHEFYGYLVLFDGRSKTGRHYLEIHQHSKIYFGKNLKGGVYKGSFKFVPHGLTPFFEYYEIIATFIWDRPFKHEVSIIRKYSEEIEWKEEIEAITLKKCSQCVLTSTTT